MPDSSAESPYGFAAWHAFCNDIPGKVVGLWERSINPLKRLLPLSVASGLVLAGCGGGGGASNAPTISVTFSGNPPSAVITSSATQIVAVANGDLTHARSQVVGDLWEFASAAPCLQPRPPAA